MKRTQIHIHVNHLREEEPGVFRHLKNELGFSVTKVKIKKDGEWGPLWLVTNKYQEGLETDNLFNEIVVLLKNDEDFYGYVEKELIVEGSIRHFEGKEFIAADIGVNSLPKVFKKRGADIHVMRDKHLPYDGLDKQLEQIGFYEVVTSVHRIWTILFEDQEQSKILYRRLLQFFEKHGGVMKVENEMVQEIIPIPSSFEMTSVVSSNSLI